MKLLTEADYLRELFARSIADELHVPEWQAYLPIADRLLRELKEYAYKSKDLHQVAGSA